MKIAPLILSLFLLSSGQVKSPGVYVLCYHSFNTDKNKFSFLLNELKSQLEFFRKKGFKFVTFSDIDSGNISGNRNLLITVDDGNRSVYDAYFTIFRPMKIKPVLAIYPAITGREKYALSWDQLKRLSNEGCEVAAHGYSHRHLSSKLYRNERKVFEREIFTSKKLLERKLGRSVDIFVYPYGVTSPQAVKALAKAGYRYAFTINTGIMSISSVREISLYDLPRYMITRGTSRVILNRIARNTEKGKHFVVVNNPEKKTRPGPEMLPLIVKPKKRPKPIDDEIKAVVVYHDRYRDYSKKKESLFINPDLKDSLLEIDEKSRIYPVDNNTSYMVREPSRETRVVAGLGIADIPNSSSMYAYSNAAMKDSQRGFLPKLKSSYKKSSVSVYKFYSLWIKRLRIKMDTVKNKIEKLIDKIFT